MMFGEQTSVEADQSRCNKISILCHSMEPCLRSRA